jgi:NTP pyrophosphatase (non-canonical NTP hydrolase)
MSKSLQDFSDKLNARWREKLRENDVENIAIPALGLVGEAGEVSEHFKKHIRDGHPIQRNFALAEELGDVLHYWCRLTALAGYSPSEIMQINEDKLEARRAAKAVAMAKARKRTGIE